MFLLPFFLPKLVALDTDRSRLDNNLKDMRIFQACLKNETINLDHKTLMKYLRWQDFDGISRNLEKDDFFFNILNNQIRQLNLLLTT